MVIKNNRVIKFCQYLLYLICSKDHPSHAYKILGGLWGFFTHNERQLAKYLFNIILDKFIANYYTNFNRPDEVVLEKYFWPFIINNSTIHDSYYCSTVSYGSTQPFPIERTPSNCYVGQIGCCGSRLNQYLESHVCPVECRSQSNKNWNYC